MEERPQDHPQNPQNPQNPLHERYASREMAALFSANRRFATWRRLWLALAQVQHELGLPIDDGQLDALAEAAPKIDLERVAEIERETRHDVVAHLRHFAEQAGSAGGVLHLGATSAFITDNTDALLIREALDLLLAKSARTLKELGEFARNTQAIPTLAYTHFQPAQLTTVGKRACLWAQDFLCDLLALERVRRDLRCRGAKGTTGTQASFLTLFQGDHHKVRELDRRIAEALGFETSWPVTGQTYPRKQDTHVLHTLAEVAESCHKLGNDLRLLQGVGELAEPFDPNQVGSSAMAYKRNPIRAERLCGLARRLITDSLNGPLNAATQWLERSLDDSSNRRLVLTDTFLCADALLALTAGIVSGLRVDKNAIAARVERELPFMASETFLMEGTLRGGDRQHLHEQIRRYSLEAYAAVSQGRANPLIDLIASDQDFGMQRAELQKLVDPVAFTGRSELQVEEFLTDHVDPVLNRLSSSMANIEQPRV